MLGLAILRASKFLDLAAESLATMEEGEMIRATMQDKTIETSSDAQVLLQLLVNAAKGLFHRLPLVVLKARHLRTDGQQFLLKAVKSYLPLVNHLRQFSLPPQLLQVLPVKPLHPQPLHPLLLA